jgi:DNA-binding CsgD family transcriptional regulator
MTTPKKLTRKQISEALDQMPIGHLLAGSAGRELTAKQKQFARLIAQGNTGASAYRMAYNAKGSPKSVGSNASRLKADERMQIELNRLKTLQEIRESQSPAQIRQTVIERLQLEATDSTNPPAARIRALELLGKVTEVAAFTERREQTVVHSSEAIKAQIMDRLKAITIDVVPVEQSSEALSLAAELNAASDATDSDSGIVDDSLNGPDGDPTVPAPPAGELESRGADIHITPHESSVTSHESS